ncbi:MAG: hypothetical protein NWF14_00235, partial [Candidatus Bathyarchaeota archaeon]|nr:hypothetical protein [Candidatus Bathyarchaeota archaeon]
MSLGSCYLMDGSSEESDIRLVFYDSTTEELRDIRDDTYKPYFFVSHPLSTEDEMTVRSLDAKTGTVEKKNLFTGKDRQLTRVELDNPSLLPAGSRLFKEKWEDGVPYILSYVYDRGLVFGAPYRLEGEKVESSCEVDETLRTRFQSKFSTIDKTDPQKYEMLERWFTLCSQPIPKLSLRKLGLGEDVDYEKVYLAFMLSRIANLPLPMALTNRHVSTWVRSILHSYLRKRNILIPRSSELRRGEKTR